MPYETTTSKVRNPVYVYLAQAEKDHFDAVATLFEALHQYNASLDPRFALADGWRPLLYDHFVQTYQHPRALWLLAWADEQPIGLLLVEAHHDSPLFRYRHWAELVALYVVPAYRGLNLAEHLVFQATEWAAARGFDRIQLYMTAHNEPARRFYHRCGFQPVQEILRLDVQPRNGHAHPVATDAQQEEPLVDWDEDLLESSHPHLTIEIRPRQS
ncbi:MAG: GNAT family N-acetyltransferase [Chloroflexaceae bacterium]|nr:GNAT family N-acetyltransferase [Chloroflexaceae bacterium]